jgi:hypothetical protein
MERAYMPPAGPLSLERDTWGAPHPKAAVSGARPEPPESTQTGPSVGRPRQSEIKLLGKLYRNPAICFSCIVLMPVTASTPALRHDAEATNSTRSAKDLTMPPALQIMQQQGTGPDRHQAMLTFTEEGWAPRLVTVEFGFSLSDQDREDIRWYLEDYLEFAQDPALRIAARIERRMEAIGDELFRALFQGSDDARDLWAALRPRLGEARIEVVASVWAATTIPLGTAARPTHRGIHGARSAGLCSRPATECDPRAGPGPAPEGRESAHPAGHMPAERR